MNIMEAVKSGRPLKRKGWPATLDLSFKIISVDFADILATDWEIEERKIEITEREFDAIVEEVNQMCGFTTHSRKELKKRLFEK